MSIFIPLLKREVLEGTNGYIRVPAILAAITVVLVVLSAAGVGGFIDVDGLERKGIENFADMLNRAQAEESDQLSAAITIGYWSMSLLTWMAFPFVVFFSLLGSLYEERRDRSILFWKSMPVDDWQEVLAKLIAPVLIAPITFLGVAIAAQLLIALFLSIVTLFQGGPVLVLWPLGLMITSWFTVVSHYLVYILWALPLLTWLLFVSSFANRMPFLWALLTPAVLIAIEGMFFETATLAKWIGYHLGGWQEYAYDTRGMDINGPRDVLEAITSGWQLQAYGYSFTSLGFWFGLIVAAAFFYGATEMRKRAS